MAHTTYSNLTVSDGSNIFYRSAGSPVNPVLLLLHGFPTSSHQYRNLIPLLSPSYHVIAPDFPGFGFTTVPSSYVYTFDNLAATIALFLSALQISKAALYIFDYGAPVGFRLATEHNLTVPALISQNGNAYVEGFGHPFWDKIMEYWKTGAEAEREAVHQEVLNLDSFKAQYTAGVPEAKLDRLDPATWTLDWLLVKDTPGNDEVQLDLFYDYRINVEKYPKWQAWLRKTQVPLLAAWGKGDPAFVPAGAKAYKKDVKGAEVKLLDTGHFALETDVEEIGKLVKKFLGAHLH